jgi:hypothetical protein
MFTPQSPCSLCVHERNGQRSERLRRDRRSNVVNDGMGSGELAQTELRRNLPSRRGANMNFIVAIANSIPRGTR